MSDQPVDPNLAALSYDENQVRAIVHVYNTFGAAMSEVGLIVRAAAQQVDEALQRWYNGLDDETKALVQKMSEDVRKADDPRG